MEPGSLTHPNERLDILVWPVIPQTTSSNKQRQPTTIIATTIIATTTQHFTTTLYNRLQYLVNTHSFNIMSKRTAVGIDWGSVNARVASWPEESLSPEVCHNDMGHRSTPVSEDDCWSKLLLMAHTKEEPLVVTTMSGKEDCYQISPAAATCLAYAVTDDISVWVIDGGASGVHATRLDCKSGMYHITEEKSLSSVSGPAFVDLFGQAIATQFEQSCRLPRGDVWASKKARAKLQRQCPSALKTLYRNSKSVMLHVDGLYEGMDCSVNMSMPKWEHLSRPLVDKVQAFLKELAQTPVDKVLLTGQLHSWLSPMVEKAFPGKMQAPSFDPVEAIAIGSAIHARVLVEEEMPTTKERTCQVPVAPSAIVFNEVEWIAAGTPLPCRKTVDISESGKLMQSGAFEKDLLQIDVDEAVTVQLHWSASGALRLNCKASSGEKQQVVLEPIL